MSEIKLSPMWHHEVGPCFAIEDGDWRNADEMRDLAKFLNNALQQYIYTPEPLFQGIRDDLAEIDNG